jgi:anaerobic ribonucleoside-triphosphate reductase activating protein
MLGGEPLVEYNRELVLTILKKVKETYPTIKTYLWSGYVWDTIIDQPLVRDIMKYVDVLIDGPFIQEKRDISLFLRGSDNQRVIDVQKTIESGSVVLYHD